MSDLKEEKQAPAAATTAAPADAQPVAELDPAAAAKKAAKEAKNKEKQAAKMAKFAAKQAKVVVISCSFISFTYQFCCHVS